MRVEPTRLRRTSFILRVFAGFCFSFLCLIVSLVGFLFPPLFLALIGVIIGPFLFLGYRAVGPCPYCYERLEVTKKYGGWQCKGCGRSISIQNKTMYPI